MVDFKGMLENFDYIRLEVVDAWQFPAVYIVYKKGFEIEDIQEDYFIKELEENEYKDIKNKLNNINLTDWLFDYLPERNEKIEEEYTWKFIVSKDGKKAVKKGKNKSPDNFSELENLMIEITYREDEI